MQRGIVQLLQQLQSLIARSQMSGLGQLDELPAIINENLKLEAVGLKLFYFLNRGRREVCSPAETAAAALVDLKLARRVSRSEIPHHEALLRVYPLGGDEMPFGVLWFYGRVSDEAEPGIAEIAQAVARLLASWERKFYYRTRTLAQLGRCLAATQTLPQLVAALNRVLFRYNRITAAALRPLYGKTLLGNCQLSVTPGHRKWKALLFGLEEHHAANLLVPEGELQLRLLPVRSLPTTVAGRMLLVSLNSGTEQVGVLTLFGGDWSDHGAETIDLLEREFLQGLGEELSRNLERLLTHERYEQVMDDRLHKLRENSTLYRITRAIHGTLRLDQLAHLLLSSLCVSDGGRYERAMLFMLNARTNSLAGMLGIDRGMAQLLLPEELGTAVWETPRLTEEVLQRQRAHAGNRLTLKQRIALDQDSPLAWSVRNGKVVLVSHPGRGTEEEQRLVRELQLSAYACVPLTGKERRLGVLLLDNPLSGDPVGVDQVRFLELFASLAASAIENALLHGRLENAHKELLDTQEKLIQEERLAVLGEMSASVAHELRNPLVSIGGFARRLVKQKDATPQQQEYAEIIARETRRMEEMLSQILAFSKKQILCMDRCSVEGIVADAVEAASDALQKGQIQLRQECAPKLPQIVADHQKLRQVLVNLIVNACQASNAGGELWLRLQKGVLRGEPAIRIEVEDAGGGIPAPVLRNIFNPFFTTKQEGTGLGLSISQRIIEHHKGEIEVFNTANGVRFTICLPVQQNSH